MLREANVDEYRSLTGFGSIKKQVFYRCLRMRFARTRQATSDELLSDVPVPNRTGWSVTDLTD
jgi:hypothetical protein